MPRSPNIQDASILLLRYECAIRSLPFAVLTDRRLGIVSMGRTDMLLLEEILHTTWDVQNSLFCQYWDIPTPSKRCQMLPKECQFTILQGLIGTPLKVLVPNWWSPDYWAINSRMASSNQEILKARLFENSWESVRFSWVGKDRLPFKRWNPCSL